jgi:hypothetical protein
MCIMFNISKDGRTIHFYRVFNLDMNSDIEFECVPNSLLNPYGIKTENHMNIYIQS